MELTHLPKLSLFSNIVLNDQQQQIRAAWFDAITTAVLVVLGSGTVFLLSLVYCAALVTKHLSNPRSSRY